MRAVVVLLLVGACGRLSFDVVDPDPGTIDGAVVDAEPALDAVVGMYRKAIAIDVGQVAGGPHNDFRVLVDIPADPDLAAHARSDGFDIEFATAGGTALAYDRQHYDGITGALLAWVRIPLLSSTTDTTIFLSYGAPATTVDHQAPALTWAGYRGVWHLDDVTGALLDRTSNANDGSAVNGPTLGATGRFDRGVAFDGVDDRIRMLDSASLDATVDAATFSLWINWTDPSDGEFQYVMVSENAYDAGQSGFEWGVQIDGDLYFYPATNNAGNYNLAAAPFANQTWHYLVASIDFATKDASLFVDGLQRALVENNVSTLWTALATPADLLWGGHPASTTKHFAGRMDELRASSAVHSPNWILTEYRNQSAPASFYVVGPEQ